MLDSTNTVSSDGEYGNDLFPDHGSNTSSTCTVSNDEQCVVGLSPEQSTCEQAPVGLAVADPIEAAGTADIGEDVFTVIDPEIDEVSSYGPKSKYVKAMAKSHDEGRPIALYEIMQGMVDYGRNHAKPPRIYFVLTSGETVMFDGTNAPEDHNQIEAIEFTNYGPGLAPEDLVIAMHDDDHAEQSTLGEHGHGTTIALSYLESQGMHTTITSNYRNREWKATSFLKYTSTGKTQTLRAKGDWGEAVGKDDQKTTFRINKPTAAIVEDMRKISKLFLYADPKHPDAIVVPADQDAQSNAKPAEKVREGTVRCLNGVVSTANQYDLPFIDYNFIYIDGVRISLGREKSIFPWDIQGLGNSPYGTVGRSTDSTEVRGYGLTSTLAKIINHTEDGEMIRAIIKTALANPETHYAELQYTYSDISGPTQEIVKSIWEAEFGGALITEHEFETREYERLKGDKKAILITTPLNSFLERAGVPTLRSEISSLRLAQAEKERQRLAEANAKLQAEKKQVEEEKQALEEEGKLQRSQLDGTKLKVLNARKQVSLDRLIENITLQGGKVDIVDLDGTQHLRIKLPHALTDATDFSGETQHSYGKLIRTAAIIADAQKIDCKIFSLSQTQCAEINIEVEKSRKDPDLYETPVNAEAGPLDLYPQYSQYEIDGTYVLLSGEQINEYEEMPSVLDSMRLDPRVEALTDIHEETLRRVNDSIRNFRIGRAGQRLLKDRVELPPKIVNTTFDKVPAHDSQKENWDGFDITDGTRMIAGFYALEAGSRLSFSKGKLLWTSESAWVRVYVSQGAPKNTCRMVQNNLLGERKVPIRSGHEIIGYSAVPKNAELTFYRDIKNGFYMVNGTAEQLTVYTAPHNEDPIRRRPPLAEEAENPIRGRFQQLDEYWQKFIDELKGSERNLAITDKAILLAEEWTDRFERVDNIDFEGKSKKECALLMVNRCAGGTNAYATGLAILLRANGIAAKVLRGGLMEANGFYRVQTWVEFFDGEAWRPLASLASPQYEPQEIPEIVAAEDEEYEPMHYDPQQRRPEPHVQSKPQRRFFGPAAKREKKKQSGAPSVFQDDDMLPVVFREVVREVERIVEVPVEVEKVVEKVVHRGISVRAAVFLCLFTVFGAFWGVNRATDGQVEKDLSALIDKYTPFDSGARPERENPSDTDTSEEKPKNCRVVCD